MGLTRSTVWAICSLRARSARMEQSDFTGLIVFLFAALCSQLAVATTPAGSHRTVPSAASCALFCAHPEGERMPRLPDDNTTVPLFTREELALAFAQVLTKGKADDLARRWFQNFADEESLDAGGRYLYRDWRDNPHAQHVLEPGPAVFVGLASRTESQNRGMYNWLSSASAEELEDSLLSLSDFTLDLVSLSSAGIRRRVEMLRARDTHINTQDRCKELARAIALLRK